VKKRFAHHPCFILTLLILLFALPAFIAHWVYKNPNWLSDQKSNLGKLIAPPVAISTFSIMNAQHELLDNTLPNKKKVKPAAQLTTNGKWMILLFYPDQCDSICLKKIYLMRQLWIATGKFQNRVERAVLTEHDFQSPFNDTRVLLIKKNNLKKKHFKFIPGATYLVDPMGYIMMVYRPNEDFEDILKDLEHLLMISQVG